MARFAPAAFSSSQHFFQESHSLAPVSAERIADPVWVPDRVIPIPSRIEETSFSLFPKNRLPSKPYVSTEEKPMSDSFCRLPVKSLTRSSLTLYSCMPTRLRFFSAQISGEFHQNSRKINSKACNNRKSSSTGILRLNAKWNNQNIFTWRF